MQRVLEKLQIALAGVVGEIRGLDHVDQGLAHVDRVDSLRIFGERVVDGLHDEPGGDPEHALAARLLLEFSNVDLDGLAPLDDLLAVVETQFRHQVALVARLQAREQREHRRQIQGVRGDVLAEVRLVEELAVDLDLLGQAQVVGDLDHDDTIEDRLVGWVSLEAPPLGLVRMGDDDRIHVHGAVAARRRDELLLRGGDHGVQILGLVLEDLDELRHAAVADVEGPVEVQRAGVALRVGVELGDVDRADQDRGVLVVGIDRRDHADPAPFVAREGHREHRYALVVPVEFLLQPEPAHRAQLPFDMHVEHLLEFLAQMLGDQVQGFLGHRAAVDRIDRWGLLEAVLQAFDQRTLAGADRAHQVEDLAALLAVHGCGMEIACDL